MSIRLTVPSFVRKIVLYRLCISFSWGSWEFPKVLYPHILFLDLFLQVRIKFCKSKLLGVFEPPVYWTVCCRSVIISSGTNSYSTNMSSIDVHFVFFSVRFLPIIIMAILLFLFFLINPSLTWLSQLYWLANNWLWQRFKIKTSKDEQKNVSIFGWIENLLGPRQRTKLF